MSKRVYLITGANSGLGYECSLALAKQENAHVILAGRNPERINEAVTKVKQAAAPTAAVEGAIVDLNSLQSTRQFARSLIQRDLQFSTIVCNAGVQMTEKSHTQDGFETTFGVNHVAHFLLLEQLKDRTQHIMMMSSETHDPAEKTGLPAPDLTDIDATAKDPPSFSGARAYATSKLCNLLYAKEFARRFPNGAEIVAYTPGFTPETGLFREHPSVLWTIGKYVIMLVNWFNGIRNSTPEYSGGFMARIASADSWTANGWQRGEYICVDTVHKPSTQACDEKLGTELWDKTAEYVRPFLA